MKLVARFKRQVPMGMGMALGVGPYNVECSAVDYDNGSLKLTTEKGVEVFPDVWAFKVEQINDTPST
jgi:hypothetical protein